MKSKRPVRRNEPPPIATMCDCPTRPIVHSHVRKKAQAYDPAVRARAGISEDGQFTRFARIIHVSSREVADVRWAGGLTI
ncbi:hypothetical protein GCM10009555_098760 [Acrocarpospora macrocephala]|uniref:Uncharacterized protein n=1 Tax=Acrocarpospora macrocephala TaxID=150177 RepID=A0A5M3X7L9_9ACTN|nr:hypothetical protein Amac_102700 [Acrocarpospora macrocephala]